MMFVIASSAARLSSRKTLFPTIITIVALSGLMGCSDDDPVRPKIGSLPSPYITPRNPQIVLVNMSYAYTHRDTVGYKDVFDDTYQGTSYDPNPPGGILTFTKSDEIRHLAALAHDPSVMSVFLQFPPVLTRYTDIADPPGWATIQMTNTHVEINGISTSYTNISSATMEFKFIPTEVSVLPPDTTWKVIRWSEFP